MAKSLKARGRARSPQTGLGGQRWAMEARDGPWRPEMGLRGSKCASETQCTLDANGGPHATETTGGFRRPETGGEGQKRAFKAVGRAW